MARWDIKPLRAYARRASRELAQALGVAAVHYKDEGSRFGLGSFKALGAPIALVRQILRLHPGSEPTAVLSGRYAEQLKDYTVISATDGNKNGFGKGEWIPYLTINYTLVNKDTGEKQSGTFMPMVASDGPHYGANIKMAGVGNYTVTYQIEPPPKAGMHRHTDKETGVARWWKPFEVKFDFKYVGLK